MEKTITVFLISGYITFTLILMGRGMPSLRSLVFSLKSLQKAPMGIPFWNRRHRRNI